MDKRANRGNNFDALRLIAATMVVFSHAMLLTYGTNGHDLLHKLSHGATFVGGLAVDVFLIMSGYLVTASYVRTNSVWRFVAARGLRIMPALVVVVGILAFVVGPVASALPTQRYFLSDQTWYFIWRNLLVRRATELPGVFSFNPLAGVINGSLWTLEIEVDCYLIVVCIGMLGLLTRYRVLTAYLLSLVASATWYGGSFGPLWAVFMGGGVMYLWQPPLKPWMAIVCALCWIAGLFLPGFRLMTATVGVYVVLFIALSPSVKLPSLSRYGDFSYGLYIWAFPVQQCIVAMTGPATGWLWNVALSVPITVGLAAMSWHLVEAPMLRMKPRSPISLLNPARASR